MTSIKQDVFFVSAYWEGLMKEQFHAKDIREALEINQRRLQYLVEKMRIDPDIEEARGSGHAHLHSFRNVLLIAVAHTLNSIGMSPPYVKKTLKFLVEETDSHFTADFWNPSGKKNFRLRVLFHEREYQWQLITVETSGEERVPQRKRRRLRDLILPDPSPIFKKAMEDVTQQAFLKEDAVLDLNLEGIKQRVVKYATS
jgi:hypothetical protein